MGTPSLYLGSIRSALFAGVLHADPPTGPGRTYYDVGGQVDFNFTFALRLPMTLSFGAASGFEHGRADQSEVFVSLKII